MRGFVFALPVIAGLGLSPAAAAPGSPYRMCAETVDPPLCLVERAAGFSKFENTFIEAVVQVGATSVIETHSEKLFHALQNKMAARDTFLQALGISKPPHEMAEQALAADRTVALAGLALAAAASTTDNPFEEGIAKRLIAVARNSPVVPQIAIPLRRETDFFASFGGDLLAAPPGMPAVWDAVIARPPANTAMLIEFASEAADYGYTAQGLILLRAAAARAGLTDVQKATIALSSLASMGQPMTLSACWMTVGGTRIRAWSPRSAIISRACVWRAATMR
jgi:hypothetical protein